MKAFSKTLLLLAGMSLLLAGCQKEGRYDSDSGLIRFSASTRPETKTVYSGVDVVDNGVTYERIDWEEGDQVRIWSPEAEDRYHSSKHYADYRVVEVEASGRLSKAKIVNAATDYPVDPGVPAPYTDENDNVNGLLWGSAGSYTFYGVYPVVTTGVLSDGGFSFTGSISTPQTVSAHTYPNNRVVYEPDLEIGYLTAATQVTTTVAGKGPDVTLEFEPAFTAFEVSLKAQNDVVGSITVLGFDLVSKGDEALTGSFSVSYAGTTKTFDCSGATGKMVSITFPEGTEIAPAKAATSTSAAVPEKVLNFTVIALPQDFKKLQLHFTVLDENDEEVERSLDLSYAQATTVGDKTYAAGDYVEFAGCKKHRIYGIAMPRNVWKFAIELGGKVLPWIYTEESTTFSQNVQAKAFYVNGAIELLNETTYPKGNHYEAYDTGTNNNFLTYTQWAALSATDQATYNDAHKTYYSQYYQQRTMDMNVTNPHFEVTFTPMAPFAGYWNLSAEAAPSYGVTAQGGPEGFTIYLWDGESKLPHWSDGQIMNQEVTLYIQPAANRDPGKEYCMIIKAFFSPNKNGEPTYSADSEMQDVHGDGRYSYWKFIIPATE